MIVFGVGAVLAGLGVAGYAYLGYPLILSLLARFRGSRRLRRKHPDEWPLISIAVSLYNEERQAEGLVRSLLALDYPPERRQILIVSDGSIDRTVEIVRSFEAQGVELIELPERQGKTGAENAVSARMKGEIVVNTDASIRILPDALKPMIAAFNDPEVGLASGRDISVGRPDEPANVGESGYVGYEMRIRDLETALHGIVGASGCFYAIRSALHRIPVPGHLSRDFAAALKCEENGFRAVSVPESACLVPRTASLHREYSRKVRTTARGLNTLIDRAHLLNPFRHGLFSWMLFSHKICRWAVPWAGLISFAGLLALAPGFAWAQLVVALVAGGLALGVVGWMLGDGRPLPRVLQIPAFGLVGNIAVMHSLVRVITGQRDAIWEPTRREASEEGSA